MSGLLTDLLDTAVDEAEFRTALRLLNILYWLAGSLPEPQADGARERLDRLRRAFPVLCSGAANSTGSRLPSVDGCGADGGIAGDMSAIVDH